MSVLPCAPTSTPVRYRSVGYDVGDANAGEMPYLWSRRCAPPPKTPRPLPEETALGGCPREGAGEHRAEFGERLAEARLVNRLRDERGVYSDGWATGLARRALLEAGRRLHGAGCCWIPNTRST